MLENLLTNELKIAKSGQKRFLGAYIPLTPPTPLVAAATSAE